MSFLEPSAGRGFKSRPRLHIFKRAYRSVHRDLLHICCTGNFLFESLHRFRHDTSDGFDVVPLRRLNVFVAKDRLNHLVGDSEFVQVRG